MSFLKVAHRFVSLVVIAGPVLAWSPASVEGELVSVSTEDGQSLGTVRLPAGHDSPAREHLARGLALLHNMTYLEAEREFSTAIEVDPDCALAYWGVAMSYVHPLWPDVVPPDKLVAAKELLERASALPRRSASEDAYIAALSAYYHADAAGDVREIDRLDAFLDGWDAARSDDPKDPEAKLFYALALTSVGMADLADRSFEKQRAAGALAEEVRAEIPLHPGAHHYSIHAYDLPELAELALDAARSYGKVAPDNSHALHMTSHIFTRLGLWSESIEFNIRAADASRTRTPSGAISLHHLHALDYLAYAYLQTADDDRAVAVFEAITALEPPFQGHAASTYSFAAVPARLALERHDWESAARLPAAWPAQVAWESYPHFLAITHFTRALGAARIGDEATAVEEIAVLASLEESANDLNMSYDWGLQVAIQKTGALAWLAFESGETERGLELMSRAAEMESSTEKNPITPGEVLPARELYGDMLLEAGRPADAVAQYEAALERSPNRFNSLFGAGRAAELAGDTEAAAGYYRRLLELCPDATGREEQLGHARGLLQ